MKLFIFLLLLLVPGALAVSQVRIIGPQDTVRITQAQDARLIFQPSEEGTYRVELSPAVALEFSLAAQGPDGQWTALASNRNLKGDLEPALEAPLKKGNSYLLIALPNPDTPFPLNFSFRKSQFSGLKTQLKDELIQALPDHLPLKEKLVWTGASEVKRLSAGWSKDGELLAALETPAGLQVWSFTQRSPLGSILAPQERLKDFNLCVSPAGPLTAWQEGDSLPLKIRFWNGTGWIDQSLPQAFGPFCWVNLPKGPVLLFRLANGILNAAWWTPDGWKKLTGEPWSPSAGPLIDSGLTATLVQDQPMAGFFIRPEGTGVNRVVTLTRGQIWTDTECPESRSSTAQLLAAGNETLFIALGYPGKAWNFYQYKESLGWQIMVSPAGLSSLNLDLCVDGGSLWAAALDRQGLQLYQFDGLQWRAPLKLQALTDGKPSKSIFLAPPPGGRSHSLLILENADQSSTVKVYELP